MWSPSTCLLWRWPKPTQYFLKIAKYFLRSPKNYGRFTHSCTKITEDCRRQLKIFPKIFQCYWKVCQKKENFSCAKWNKQSKLSVFLQSCNLQRTVWCGCNFVSLRLSFILHLKLCNIITYSLALTQKMCMWLLTSHTCTCQLTLV